MTSKRRLDDKAVLTVCHQVEILHWRQVIRMRRISNVICHPTPYNGCYYLSMLGLKLNHFIKGAPGGTQSGCLI